MQELSADSGLENAAIYWDFSTFFVSLRLVNVLRECQRIGFSPRILIIDLFAQLGLRAIKFDQAYTRPCEVANSVLAGGRFSTTYAKLYLYDLLELLHAQLPLQIDEHVDDLAQCGADTSQERLVAHMLRAAEQIHSFSRESRLEISPKTAVVTSNSSLQTSIVEGLRAIGVVAKSAKGFRDIGLDAGAGQRRQLSKPRGSAKPRGGKPG